MSEAPPYDHARRFSRITFHRPAVLDLRVWRAECEVLDVSLKGALVEVGPGLHLAVGDACSLVIRLDGGDAIIRMDGELAHVSGRRVGVKADEMELESVEHLRRLVEVNLGDEDVLHRELAALVAERSW
jgi:PilZ domain-containing protein